MSDGPGNLLSLKVMRLSVSEGILHTAENHLRLDCRQWVASHYSKSMAAILF